MSTTKVLIPGITKISSSLIEAPMSISKCFFTRISILNRQNCLMSLNVYCRITTHNRYNDVIAFYLVCNTTALKNIFYPWQIWLNYPPQPGDSVWCCFTLSLLLLWLRLLLPSPSWLSSDAILSFTIPHFLQEPPHFLPASSQPGMRQLKHSEMIKTELRCM